MKRLTNASPLMQTKALSLKYLVVAVASMMIVPVAQADVSHRKIGDLEIYKAAEGGNIVITMMLDTSGSMTINQVNYACDLPSGTSVKKRNEYSNTTPRYRRDYCQVPTEHYFYRESPQGQWYRCGDSNGAGSYSFSFNACSDEINDPLIGSEYSITTSGSNNKWLCFNNVLINLMIE